MQGIHEGASMWKLSEAILAVADAVEERDVHALRKLSNKALGEVSLNGRNAFLKPAMLAYAFAKVIQKPHYWRERSPTVFFGKALTKMAKAAGMADKDEGGAEELLDEVAAMIGELDGSEQRYIKGLMDKSQLKIASTLYAQGFSLDRAVEMTGADKRELIRYIGKTFMFDRTKNPKSINDRLKALKSILS